MKFQRNYFHILELLYISYTIMKFYDFIMHLTRENNNIINSLNILFLQILLGTFIIFLNS